MCGRFVIEYSWAEVHDALNLIPASAKGLNDPQRQQTPIIVSPLG